ncbi:PorT family protein [Chitinophaga sedimenti]|uniref:outer membrane beta-barrel protein n=1 Tax=Chitinophaga sedimenti TaxID=2033606 RepID=UPI0020054012|nr:outer membrane beta-barrel protein [Chitinophaga sedimenti]MCK7558829.1 PorT family protein [Chitinophaga sedimenti]
MKYKILLVLAILCTALEGMGQVQTADTVQIKGLIIVKTKDVKGRSNYKLYQDTVYQRNKLKKNIHTKWLVFDLGFNNYRDKSKYYEAQALNYYAPITNSNIGLNDGYYNGSSNKQFDYSPSGLQTFAPRAASSPLTPSEFKLLTGKSINFNVWLFQQRLNIYKHKFNLQYALGLEMNNYHFARNITYQPGYPTTIMRDTVEFSKNKLFAQYLTVPLMLNYTSNPLRPNRAFKASFGLSGGYLLKARTKQISDERGKIKRTDDFNLNKWRAGFTGELGYGPVKLYGNFAFTPLHDYGLEQFPFAIGLRLNGF